MAEPDDVKRLLLSVGDLGRITGFTGLTNVGVLNERRSARGVEPFECGYVSQAGTSLGYGGPSNEAFAGDAYTGDENGYVEQVLAVYDDRGIGLVSAFMSAESTWTRCPEVTPHTVITDSGVWHYVRGPVQSSPRRAAVTVTRQEQPPRTCRHVVAAKANVIADAVVCGGGDTARQADAVVDGLLAEVPE